MIDEQLLFWINGHHTPWLDTFFWTVSLRSVWIPMYLIIVLAVWRRYSWRGALTILLMVGIGMLFTDYANSHYLRPWIGRLRPSNPENPIAPLLHIVNGKIGHGYGFPSCHSSNIWLITLLTIHWLRTRFAAIAMCIVALLWCYSRVYLAMHYPGDIIGGFILAALVFGGLLALHRHLHHRYPTIPYPKK